MLVYTLQITERQLRQVELLMSLWDASHDDVLARALAVGLDQSTPAEQLPNAGTRLQYRRKVRLVKKGTE